MSLNTENIINCTHLYINIFFFYLWFTRMVALPVKVIKSSSLKSFKASSYISLVII